MTELARLAVAALTLCIGFVAAGLRHLETSVPRMTEELCPIPVRVDEVRRNRRR